MIIAMSNMACIVQSYPEDRIVFLKTDRYCLRRSSPGRSQRQPVTEATIDKVSIKSGSDPGLSVGERHWDWANSRTRKGDSNEGRARLSDPRQNPPLDGTLGHKDKY